MEGKDKPTEDCYAESKFKRDFGSKFSALVVRIAGPLWGSGRSVMMESGF